MGSHRDEPCSDYGPAGGDEYLTFTPYANSPIQLINAFIRKHRVGGPRPTTLPFVVDKDIERILRWPNDQSVKATPEWYEGAGPEAPTAVAHELAFVANDPGRQYLTGSFHPDERDWFAQAYGEEE